MPLKSQQLLYFIAGN